MKIVNGKQLAEMPDGTLYHQFQPEYVGELCILRAVSSAGYLQSVAVPYAADFGRLYREGGEEPMNFDSEGGGHLDPEDLFAVWSDADFDALVAKVQTCRRFR
jgi:hypothetical protein